MNWKIADGSEYTGTVQNVAENGSTAYGVITSVCVRCGGNGGYYCWPGFTCFACKGSGKLTHQAKLYSDSAYAKLVAAKERRAAAITAKLAAKRLAELNRQAEKMAKYNSENPDVVEFLNSEAASNSRFLESMKIGLSFYGSLTDNQTAAVRKSMAAIKATSNSQHLGTVGEKITLTLTVDKIIEVETRFGLKYSHICHDENQNVVVYYGDLGNLIMTSEVAEVSCKVKEHTVYNGVKQTKIFYPKVSRMIHSMFNAGE